MWIVCNHWKKFLVVSHQDYCNNILAISNQTIVASSGNAPFWKSQGIEIDVYCKDGVAKETFQQSEIHVRFLITLFNLTLNIVVIIYAEKSLGILENIAKILHISHLYKNGQPVCHLFVWIFVWWRKL